MVQRWFDLAYIGAWSIEWNQNGDLLLSCGNDKEVKVYDKRRGKLSKLCDLELSGISLKILT